ncbi:MAG: hypothetical protein AAF797_04435 [Planctomycetota bacterium]
MLWLINLILLVFLLGAAFLWATYGLFSALIQLGIVIVAGALAFAIWEPLAEVLLGRMPAVAWGVALLAPFALLLIGLRVAFDKLIKANVQTNNLLNQIGGGAVGLVAGYLAAGVALLGIAHLPMGDKILGYQPFQASGFQTDAAPESDLWPGFQADRNASAFFTTLAAGPFSPTLSDANLATHRPNPYEAAHRIRLGPDPAAANTVAPDAVEVLGIVTASPSREELSRMIAYSAFDAIFQETSAESLEDFTVTAALADARVDNLRRPETLEQLGKGYGEEGKPGPLSDMLTKMADDLTERVGNTIALELAGNRKLLLVPTRWSKSPTSFDTDSRLRINPTQARLYFTGGSEPLEAAPPVAVSRVSAVRGGRILFSFADNSQVAGDTDTEELVFVFAVPDGATPQLLMLRNLRFELPEPKDISALQTAKLLGAPAFADAPPAQPTSGQAAGIEGVSIEISNRLPRALGLNTTASSLRRNSDNNALVSGEGLARKPTSSAPIRFIEVPAGDGMVRMQITPRVAQSMLGRARDRAASVHKLHVRDNFDQYHNATAYVITKPDGSQFIGIKPTGYGAPIEMQLSQLTNDDEFYIYFTVPAGRRVEGVVFGLFRQGEEVDLPEPIEVPAASNR